ncbi:MAG: SRPBCC family protein [Candidatus Limnocylindrales bacterium]
MGRVGASLQIPYPADDVFRVATRVEDMPRWLPDVQAAELLDPVFTVGSRVRLKMGASAAGTELIGTVRQMRAPTILAIGGSAGPLTVEVRTRLDAVSPTATRMVLEIEVGASPLLGFVAREAERRINAELPAALERFKSLMAAEAAELA